MTEPNESDRKALQQLEDDGLFLTVRERPLLLQFRAQARAEEANRIEAIIVAAIDQHDAVEEDGYQKPCAKPEAFCECFGISTLRSFVAAIRALKEKRG